MNSFNLLSHTIALCFFTIGMNAQQISQKVPADPEPGLNYIFYLHGGIVQSQGANAVSKIYGKYEYNAILDTLKSKGFYVISEVRSKNSTEIEYAKKVRTQLDLLLSKDVPAKNITILGASLGAYIALHIAMISEEKGLKYVLLGLCSDYSVNYFSKSRAKFSGNFLSIYEKSDSKGSCQGIFTESLRFKEIQLNMGNSHAFLYKPNDEWIEPMVNWINAD